MSEHVVTEAARQLGERDAYLDAVAAQAARYDTDWSAVRALEPGAEPAPDLVARLKALSGTINAFETQYGARLGTWCRGQRLAVQAEARRLLGPDGIGDFGAPQWEPWR